MSLRHSRNTERNDDGEARGAKNNERNLNVGRRV